MSVSTGPINFEARQPDYKVSARIRGKQGGNIGSAWVNDNGTVSIILKPFVVLSAIDDLQITMFKYEEDTA